MALPWFDSFWGGARTSAPAGGSIGKVIQKVFDLQNRRVRFGPKSINVTKQIINKELREIVPEPGKCPEIVFKSADVTGKALGNGQYELKIGGALTLHGVTRHIIIPAKVTLNGNSLRAVGEFSIDRSDFNVKAISAFHGMVRVREKVKFTFDIVGHRV